jgi:hypothetical protein
VSPGTSGGAAPTGNVDFFDGTTKLGTMALATVNGVQQASFTVSSLSLGTHDTIKAVFVGTANYSGSNDTTSQVVNAAQTTVSVSSSSQTSVFGEPVTFTIKVDASPSTATPTGDVNLSINGSSVGDFTLQNGQATFTTSSLEPGTYQVTATYTSDTSNFQGSSTGTPVFKQQVNAASTSARVLSSAGVTDFGQPVTFVIFVSSESGATPTGQATLMIDGAPAGTFTLQGGVASFTTTLPAGDHSVFATFASDSNRFLSSTNNPAVTVTVNGPVIPNASVPRDTILSTPFAGLVTILRFKKGKKILLVLLNNTGETIVGRLVLFGLKMKQVPGALSFFGTPMQGVFLAPHGAQQITLPAGNFTPIVLAGI